MSFSTRQFRWDFPRTAKLSYQRPDVGRVSGLVTVTTPARSVEHAVTPRALAFSAGTFLHLALADLLPQVHRRADVRRPATAALVIGVGLMWLLRFTEA